LQLSGNGTGNVQVTDSLQVNTIAAYTLNADLTLSGSGTGAVKITTAFYVDTIESRTTNTNLTLSANGNGIVKVSDDLDVTGKITTDTIESHTANTDLTLSGNGTGVVYVSDTLKTTAITTGAAGTAGSITGNWSLTTGSRMQATYADLAEIYATDQEYEVGTVVMFGGDKEVTIANEYATTRVAGVISTDPAFIMNNTAEGQPIALKGRIPVKVEGIVRKGVFYCSQ